MKNYTHRRTDIADSAAFKVAVDDATAADDLSAFPAGEVWIVGPADGATAICTVVLAAGVPAAHTITSAAIV